MSKLHPVFNPATYTMLPATGLHHKTIKGFVDCLPFAGSMPGSEALVILIDARILPDADFNKLKAHPNYKDDFWYEDNIETNHRVIHFGFNQEWYSEVIHLFQGNPSLLSKEYLEFLCTENSEYKKEILNHNVNTTESEIEIHNTTVAKRKETLH